MADSSEEDDLRIERSESYRAALGADPHVAEPVTEDEGDTMRETDVDAPPRTTDNSTTNGVNGHPDETPPGDSGNPPFPGEPEEEAQEESQAPGLVEAEAEEAEPEKKAKKSKKKKVITAADADVEYTEHILDLPGLVEEFPESKINVKKPQETSGLSTSEAEMRLENDGPNELSPPPRPSTFYLLIKQFANPFLVLLLLAGALFFLAYGLDSELDIVIAAAVLVAVVIINALMSFRQELATAKVQNLFTKLLPKSCTVIRDGKEQQTKVTSLVVGDVVQLDEGGRVPADCRVLHSTNLHVDKSSLNGESLPFSVTGEVSKPGTEPLQSTALAFNGSPITQGHALGLVIRTGDDTFIGRVATLANSTQSGETTFEREVRIFIRIISVLAITMALILFAVSVGRRGGDDIVDSLVNGFIVIVVANVPQGIPTTVISLLTVAARKLADHNVFVKRLDSVEALGSASLICTDKTGTLTTNQMTVTELWLDRAFVWESFGALLRPEPRAEEETSEFPNSFEPFYLTASVCNNAYHSDTTEQVVGEGPAAQISHMTLGPERSNESQPGISNTSLSRRPSQGPAPLRTSVQQTRSPSMRSRGGGHITNIDYFGNPSEVALLRFCHQLRSTDPARRNHPVVFEIPFNSAYKYHMVVTADSGSQAPTGKCDYHTLLKGAPEVVLKRCSHYILKGKLQKIDDAFKTEFAEAYDYFAKRGRRVLGFAYKTFTDDTNMVFDEEKGNFPTTDLVFVGLSAIVDPPRGGVREAIERCHTANIKVFMVTGDHSLTAEAIARQVGILPETDEEVQDKRLQVIEGRQISSLTEDDWKFIMERNTGTVFARTTPQHKLNIVRRCRTLGAVVAVTGDGVNDAPAMRAAHIGIAMGQRGSEVAKEAANVVLVDDNFASIVRGIEEGRVLFDNLKKTIAYTLTHLLPEILPVILTIIAGLPAGLTTLQILSIDLGTELAPAISLAYEPAEKDIMLRPPRDINSDRLVSRNLLVYSYLIVGVLESIACFIAYVWVYSNNGFSLSDLVYRDQEFGVDGEGLICPGDGTTCYTVEEQKDIKKEAAAAWYLTLIVTQLFHLVNIKATHVSIFHHQWTNPVTYYAIALSLALAIMFVYVPGLNDILGAAPVAEEGWVPPIVAGVILFAFSELRAKYLRKAAKDGRNTCCVRSLAW